MNRDAPHELRETPFALETLHKGGSLDESQGVDNNSTGQVDTSRGKELQREIASLARQDRDEEVDRCRTQLARVHRICGLTDNHNRRIGRRIDQLRYIRFFFQMFHIAKIPIEIRNPNSRTDVLEAHVVERISISDLTVPKILSA